MAKAGEPVVLVASAEFILKSSPVRRTLEQRLIDDLKFTLRRHGLECSRVEKDAARLVVFGTSPTEEAAALCSNVFGVSYSAPAQLLMNTSLHDITEKITEVAQQRLPPGSLFAIRSRRSTPGTISRREVELQGGSSILGAMKDRAVKVDLEAPDVTFYVDLVGRDAYIYSEKLKGPGGLPLSAQWKMLAVLDRGPLSILAAVAMMRRGSVVQLFIPVSDTLGTLCSSMQMALAETISRLVTRPNYTAFVFEVDRFLDAGSAHTDGWRRPVRQTAAKFASDNRFKGLVFGDISGHLSDLGGVSAAGIQLPTFYPLLALQPEDLTELSRLVRIGESELVCSMDSGNQSPDLGGTKQSAEVLDSSAVREVRL